MANPLVLLVQQAREVEVGIGRRPDGTLAIRTTAAVDSVARAVRARDQDVLKLYDWTRAGVDNPAPCLLCGKPAMLRDPVEYRPCHKVCIDALIKPEPTIEGHTP